MQGLKKIYKCILVNYYRDLYLCKQLKVFNWESSKIEKRQNWYGDEAKENMKWDAKEYTPNSKRIPLCNTYMIERC